MTGRVHTPTNFRGSNTSAANGWLLRSDESTDRGDGDVSGQLAAARSVLSHKSRKRDALIVREADAPVDSAIDTMVQLMRAGRMNPLDVQETQRRELDRLKGLKTLKGDSSEISRLEALTAVRGAALDAMRVDPVMNVNYPVSSMSEYNHAHDRAGRFASGNGGVMSAPEGGGGAGERNAEGDAHITEYRGLKIYALHTYTTPYYYAERQQIGGKTFLGRVNHTTSIKRLRFMIDKVALIALKHGQGASR